MAPVLSRSLFSFVLDRTRSGGGESGQARGLGNAVGAVSPTLRLRWMAGPAQQTSIEGMEAGGIRTSDEALACGTPGDGSWSERLVFASGRVTRAQEGWR